MRRKFHLVDYFLFTHVQKVDSIQAEIVYQRQTSNLQYTENPNISIDILRLKNIQSLVKNL